MIHRALCSVKQGDEDRDPLGALLGWNGSRASLAAGGPLAHDGPRLKRRVSRTTPGGVMTPLTMFLALFVVITTRGISSQLMFPSSQATGPSSNGLRLGLSPVGSGNLPATGAEFYVALENTADSDFVLNLGQMLANGKVMFPSAIHLTLTDPAGRTQDLHFTNPKYAFVAGRMDDFTVALRSGSIYALRLSLNQYWSPTTETFAPKLGAGRHRIAARFEGQGARTVNSDMHGAALLNFWVGTVESNVVSFVVSE